MDEFVIGGKETAKQGQSYDSKKEKVICAVKLTEEGKIKEDMKTLSKITLPYL